MAGRKPKQRTVGESYRPVATIRKMKKGEPTVLEIGGARYVRQSPDAYNAKPKKQESAK